VDKAWSAICTQQIEEENRVSCSILSLRGTFRHISAQLFVPVQPEGDEGIEAVNVSESTEADGGDTQAEIAVRGASAAEDAEDNGEAEANTSTEAVATEAAAALEM
jgi:hypothetical protein